MLARLIMLLLAVSCLALPSARGQQGAQPVGRLQPATQLRAVPAQSRQPPRNLVNQPQSNERQLRYHAGRIPPAPPQARSIRQVSHQVTTAAPSVVPGTAQSESTLEEEKHAEASEPFILLKKEDEAGTEINATGSPSDADLMIRFATWTVIILCCCLLTVLGIRRWQRSRGILPATDTKSRVLETVSLGPGRSVSLVQLADVRAVIGCDSTGVSSIVLAQPSFEDTLRDSEEDEAEGFELESDQAA